MEDSYCGISLTWNSFSVESGYNCPYDWVEVFAVSDGGLTYERIAGEV